MSKILIIEDEVAIADLEKDYLELSGFDVQIEYAGDKGLMRALKEDFDLIVLDLMLPGIDGFEVCRRIREEKNVPILMVSAKKDVSTKSGVWVWARRLYDEAVFTERAGSARQGAYGAV